MQMKFPCWQPMALVAVGSVGGASASDPDHQVQSGSILNESISVPPGKHSRLWPGKVESPCDEFMLLTSETATVFGDPDKVPLGIRHRLGGLIYRMTGRRAGYCPRTCRVAPPIESVA